MEFGSSHSGDNTFWPSLNGNGPEALAQTLVYGLIAVALIPPIRRAIERFTKRHVDSIKAHVTAEHQLVHDKLDHVIQALQRYSSTTSHPRRRVY